MYNFKMNSGEDIPFKPPKVEEAYGYDAQEEEMRFEQNPINEGERPIFCHKCACSLGGLSGEAVN